MSRISKVRNYVRSVATDLTEWKDGFNRDNIPASLKNKSYFCSYEISSNDPQGDYEINTVRVTIEVFFRGFKDAQGALDSAMDSVNVLSLNLCSLASINAYKATDDFPIQSVTRLSQVPSPINTNDNQILITLELEMEIIQTLC